MRVLLVSLIVFLFSGCTTAKSQFAFDQEGHSEPRHYIIVKQPDTTWLCLEPMPGRRLSDYVEVKYLGPGWRVWQEGRCLNGYIRFWFIRREGVYEDSISTGTRD